MLSHTPRPVALRYQVRSFFLRNVDRFLWSLQHVISFNLRVGTAKRHAWVMECAQSHRLCSNNFIRKLLTCYTTSLELFNLIVGQLEKTCLSHGMCSKSQIVFNQFCSLTFVLSHNIAGTCCTAHLFAQFFLSIGFWHTALTLCVI